MLVLVRDKKRFLAARAKPATSSAAEPCSNLRTTPAACFTTWPHPLPHKHFRWKKNTSLPPYSRLRYCYLGHPQQQCKFYIQFACSQDTFWFCLGDQLVCCEKHTRTWRGRWKTTCVWYLVVFAEKANNPPHLEKWRTITGRAFIEK